MSETLLILLYVPTILLIYIFIIKRLKFLNDKHIKQTWIACLERKFRFLLKVVTILFLILFILWIFIITNH